jgi:sigma-B regulation protein RsbU (phosphoserine phosphatase)
MRIISPELVRSPLEILREEELNEARAIQGAMLPMESLRAGKITVAHRLRPVHEVGGDFLDYFALSDQTIGVYLGDVAGKGLPAALYAALVVGTLRGVDKTGRSPAGVLSLLNKRLCMRAIPSRYAAVLYAVFDPKTSEMHISSAGMHGPLHLSQRGCHDLHLSGLPPGMFPGTEYDHSTIKLEPGDSVVFMTDGIAELRQQDADASTLDHLIDVCTEHAAVSPSCLLDAMFASVDQHMGDEQQHDDMAAAVFHFAK